MAAVYTDTKAGEKVPDNICFITGEEVVHAVTELRKGELKEEEQNRQEAATVMVSLHNIPVPKGKTVKCKTRVFIVQIL